MVCDGAGLDSNGDHSNPKASSFKPLSDALMQYLQSKHLVQDIAQSLSQGSQEHPIASHHRYELASIFHQHLHPNCNNPDCMAISEGQPFRLRLIQARAGARKDPDTALLPLLEKGVLTGFFEPIAPSNHWPRKQEDLPCEAPDDIEILHCSGNWTQAENNAAIMDGLLEQEIQHGWVKVFDGSREAAKAHWPQRTAIGKQPGPCRAPRPQTRARQHSLQRQRSMPRSRTGLSPHCTRCAPHLPASRWLWPVDWHRIGLQSSAQAGKSASFRARHATL